MPLTNEEIKQKKHSLEVHPFMDLPNNLNYESIDIVFGMTQRYLMWQTKVIQQANEMNVTIEKLLHISDYFEFPLTRFFEEKKFKECLKFQLDKDTELPSTFIDEIYH